MIFALFGSISGQECKNNTQCVIGNISWYDPRYNSLLIRNCYVNETEKNIRCTFDFANDNYVVEDLIGEIETYVSHNHTRSKENVSYSMKLRPNDTSSFNSLPLKTNKTVGLITGDNIKLSIKNPRNVTGSRRLLSELTIGDLEIDDITLLNVPRTGTKDFVIGGRPVNITSVTMIVSVCNVSAQLTKDKLSSRYFIKDAKVGEVTLEGMHSICSYNKLLFHPSNNIIVSNITLPCSGKYNNAIYNSSNCDSSELYGWMNDALNQVKRSGVDITKYKRRILILPHRSKCPWSGLASIGCTTSCNTWINMAPRTDEVNLPTLFQELSHNIGLMHSNRNVSWTSTEYGDCTDPMGCGGPRAKNLYTSMSCINGAQQFKAGWAYPIEYGNMDLIGTFEDGLPYIREVPALALSDKNTIRIRISAIDPFKTGYSQFAREHVLYIMYRVRQPNPGFDSGLADDMDQKVYIYTYNMTVRSPPSPDPSEPSFKPTLISVLNPKPGGFISSMKNILIKRTERYWYGSLGYGLNITMVSKTNRSAIVSMCRFNTVVESSYEQCTDLIDNDCNGLYDADDPSCFRALNITLPPIPTVIPKASPPMVVKKTPPIRRP
jgi:hypothetical protein